MHSPPAFNGVISLTNRCKESKSPYVRSHMDNPTAWQLWNTETLDLARKTNRLLFISIGYSACHWCHVMAHESFDNPRIAQLLNQHFIPIKIDREERPDIDRQYMDFLQATSGGGGWPLNVFATPDLEPIYGGTYWPGPGSERAAHGAGFEQVLLKVATAWKEQETRCRQSAKEITKQLREFAQEGTLQEGSGEDDGLELDVLDDAFSHYKQRFDPKYGGFGAAPKFPTPVHIRPMLRVASFPTEVRDIVGDDECAEARAMAVKTLEHMARGGIKDQIGHGFARYSVTRDWSLPHFEKMLYDNAQLLPVYLDAYLLTKSPLFLETAHDIAQYLTSAPMVSPGGGIFASEDADSLPASTSTVKSEGAYYVWTWDEIEQVLSADEAKVAAAYWGVQPDGNVDSRFDVQNELTGQNTLCVSATPAELASEFGQPESTIVDLLKSARHKLLAYRDANRPRPALDDKIVTAWNGLALGALARAGSALQTPAYLDAAIAVARFIHTTLYDPTTQTLQRIAHSTSSSTPSTDSPAFADDYAFFISGLIDLYEATFNPTYLRWADTLQQTQLHLFWDADRGAFFSTPAHQPDILVRVKDAMDNAEPSINGVSALNLFRLASLLGDPTSYSASTTALSSAATNSTVSSLTTPNSNTQPSQPLPYAALARRTVACFEVEITQHPGLMSGLLAALVASKIGMRSVLIAGNGPIVDAALKAAREGVRPLHTVLRVGHGSEGIEEADLEWLRERNELVRAVEDGREMVQVCESGVCRILGVEEVGKLFEG